MDDKPIETDVAAEALAKVGGKGIVLIQTGTIGLAHASDLGGNVLDHLQAWATIHAYLSLQVAEDIAEWAEALNVPEEKLHHKFYELSRAILDEQGEPEGTKTTIDGPNNPPNPRRTP